MHAENYDSLVLLRPPSILNCPILYPIVVWNAIKRWKSPGLDKIPNFALKQLSRNAIILLTRIFNRTIQLGHFPTPLTSAIIVVPISKSSKHLASSWHLSSHLSSSSLISYLKVSCSFLLDHQKQTNHLPDKQFGFRRSPNCLQ